MATTPPPPRTLYRVIRSRHPSWADFLSNLVRDQPARQAEIGNLAEWAGVSTFEDLEEARDRAQRFPILGRYIAELVIPDDAPVLIEPSVGPGHWTIVGGPGLLLRYVARVVHA